MSRYTEDGHVFLMRKRGWLNQKSGEFMSGARGVYNSIEELMTG